MNIFGNQRSAQSKMLLALSFGTCVGITPFAFYRAYQGDWAVALLNIAVVLGMSLIFIYVYTTDNVKKASVILILVALIGNVISFYLKGISQVGWIYPAMLSAYYIMNPKKGLILNFIMLTFYLPKLFSLLEAINVATILVTVTITNVIAYVFASGLKKQAEILRKLASEDYLTSTGNRRALSIKLEGLHRDLRNHDKTASIILLDLDHFKKVNDTYGHIRGDEILKQLASLIIDYLKTKETIYRYGGEEFLIVCADTRLEYTTQIAMDIRNIVKENIKIDGHEQTISLGVAEYIKEEEIDEWIHRVDLALYQAKNEGRDRVIKAG